MANEPAGKPPGDPDFSVVVHEVRKADSPNQVGSSAMEAEDAFAGMYYSVNNAGGNVICPPYDLDRLFRFVQENNTLGQCVCAMEVNVDGTGYEIERRDEESMSEEDKKIVQPLIDFFDEPWPNMSFTTLRRAMRRDMESCGCGYIEVLRNPAREIVFARKLDAQTMRLARLGEPTPLTKTITRGGKKQEITVLGRERVFVQKVGSRTVYFKEFGATRDIDKDSGKWAPKGTLLPAANRGTEIIYFPVQKDTDTPYGLPRWINQLPSVIGSRKAEEFNLDYFDMGGIPPAIVFISGGQASPDSVQYLKDLLSGGAKKNMRGAVVEVHSTSGDINAANTAQTRVERFGSEQKNDATYQAYDEKCEMRVRGSFRLPPLFVGRAEDNTFATAYVSYMIAEGQVFQPERDEFDEIINVTLVRELMKGDDTYWFRSKPLPISNTEFKMKAVELAKGEIDEESFIESLNEITGTNLRYDEEKVQAKRDRESKNFLPPAFGGEQPPTPAPTGAGMPAPQGEGVGTSALRKEEASPEHILRLVDRWVAAQGLFGEEQSRDVLETITAEVIGLAKEDRNLFNAMLTSKTMSYVDMDREGLPALCGCAAEICGGIGGRAEG